MVMYNKSSTHLFGCIEQIQVIRRITDQQFGFIGTIADGCHAKRTILVRRNGEGFHWHRVFVRWTAGRREVHVGQVTSIIDSDVRIGAARHNSGMYTTLQAVGSSSNIFNLSK